MTPAIAIDSKAPFPAALELDADGDESEVWLGLRDVAVKLDADIAEDYARFECDRIEDFRG